MKWLLALATAAKLAAQCGIAPTPLSYDPASGGTAIPADAATYTISVDTGAVATCAWKVTAAASWITLSEAGGSGSGSFTWTAALNPTNAQRKASIVLSGSVTISVVQLANTCTPVLSASSASAPVGGGPGSFAIQTVCQWNAAGNQSWIAVSPPANGTGNGTVNYTVSANGCVAARGGVITAQAGSLGASSSNAAAAFTINQDGAAGNLTLAPATIALGASGGSGRISLTTGAGCAWSAYTDAQNWIKIVSGASGTGSSSIGYTVSVNAGAFRAGHIFVGAQSVTITQDAVAAPAPQVTAVANAASYAAGPIAPGEVVALGGTGLGPTPGVGAQLAADGQSITTALGGVQVLFDGQYPAALTYVSAVQINAIAPYEIAGKANTQIQVSYQGATSSAFEAQVQPAAPGIFTLDFNGIGNGAILNQNYSVNGKSYPAPRGSTVMIFCTGGGSTDPASTDAAITAGVSTLAVQPVTVTIGGISTQVNYAGGAPSAVAGLTQINAVVPKNAPTGANVPVTVQVGSWQSQPGVTMVVE